MGLSDEHGNNVSIRILVVVEKDADPVEVTHVTGPSQLQFLDEVLEATEKRAESPADPATSSDKGKKRVAQWALLDSAPDQIREEHHWPKLLSGKDHLMQAIPARPHRSHAGGPGGLAPGLHCEGLRHLSEAERPWRLEE